MNTIISTKPYSCTYSKNDIDINSHIMRTTWSCRINGGAGVAHGKGQLFTPNGVATEIDDEGLSILMTIPAFLNDIKKGYMTVIKGSKAKIVDADEVSEGMNHEHMARPLTDKDFKDSGAKIDSSDGSIDITGDSESTESVVKKAIRRRGKRS